MTTAVFHRGTATVLEDAAKIDSQPLNDWGRSEVFRGWPYAGRRVRDAR